MSFLRGCLPDAFLRLAGLPVLVAACLLPLIGTSCDEDPDPLPHNQRPHVRITGGPPQDTEDSYTSRVWWTGWDFDGVIVHYEYAVDPPPEFTEAEVNSPESFPDIRRTVIRGPAVGRDTLRFSKTAGGITFRFDYVQTVDFSRVFAFGTPRADSGNVGGSIRGPLARFSGTHALYVRSFDNEAAYSDVDVLGYTAVTLTPGTTILRPKVTGQILTVGPQLNVTWDGLDPDATDPRKKPVGYLYKLARLDRLSPPIPILSATDPAFVMYRAARDIPWIYQRAETTQVRLLVEPGSYMFAVRAVDQAGAVEPFLNFTRSGGPGNAFVFSSVATGGRPHLTVTEPSLGTATFRGLNSPSARYQVAIGQRLYFTWSANADDYGGEIEGYNWGVDIPDIEREGPNSGWRGWSKITANTEPVAFSRPGFHVVYVKVRDVGGAQTLGAVFLTVVDFPLDRELLIVDDHSDGVWPTDAQHDAFWRKLAVDSGRFTDEDLRPELLNYAVQGPNDTFFYTPVAPDLSLLSRYRNIFWYTKGGGSSGSSGLLITSAVTRHLATYSRVGGKLWLSGEQTVASTIPTEGGTANFAYPHELKPGMFAWDVLRLYTTKVDNLKYAELDKHGMSGVNPYPGKEAFFPAMHVDYTKLRLGNQFGVGGTDLVVDPIFERSVASHTGRIDSLYVYEAIGTTRVPPRGSPYHGRLVGVRYHDTQPLRSQGRTVWFGFSLYYLKTSEVQETFNRVVDWFREEEVGAP